MTTKRLTAPAAMIMLTAALLTCEKVPDYCGKGEWYDPKFQFCFASKAYSLCGGEEYNPLTQGCTDKEDVGTRCADSTFVKLGTPCGGYALATASAPADGGTVAITRTSQGPNYKAGEQVILIAEPKSGYVFAGWTGAQTSANAAVTVTMDDNKPMVAMFKPTTTTLVTTAFPQDGGTIDRVVNGTQVTVTATTAPNYTFTNWAGASTSTSPIVTVTVDEGKTLVAMFTPDKHTLTTNASPATGGTVFVNNTASTGTTQHDAGTTVQLLARAAEGYAFTGWSGASTSADSATTINITNSNLTLTANFKRGDSPAVTTYTLTTSVNPSGGGTVTRNPNQASYNAGTQVTVTASAAQGYTFTGWSGASTSANRSVTITMDGNKALTANFQQAGTVTKGSFTDSRDGKSYSTVKIGELTWMAENLNFRMTDSSWCYDDADSNCVKYGRLYTWNAAMTACPAGWHLPTNNEWWDLINTAGDQDGASRKLKSTTGWNDYEGANGNGINEFGFSALPGGWRACLYDEGSDCGDFGYGSAGQHGYWWSATTACFGDICDYVTNCNMDYRNEIVGMTSSRGNDAKRTSLSVRCVSDVGTPPPTT